MDYEVEGVRLRQAKENLEWGYRRKDCQIRQICTEKAMDHRKWRKLHNRHKDRVWM